MKRPTSPRSAHLAPQPEIIAATGYRDCCSVRQPQEVLAVSRPMDLGRDRRTRLCDWGFHGEALKDACKYMPVLWLLPPSGAFSEAASTSFVIFFRLGTAVVD